MSLTKNDLKEIENLINKSLFESFEKILIPYVDASISSVKTELKEEIRDLRSEMNFKFREFREEVDDRFRDLRGDMNEGFAVVHTRIDESIALNGRYFEECAKKEDLHALEARVTNLEMVA